MRTTGTCREAETAKQQRDELCVNTMRTLSMDAVQRANSGHPGTPMAMAPVAYCLWQRVLRFDPQDPIWPNRDRFVLSMGHASMLLYVIAPKTFGASAPLKELQKMYGFTVDGVVAAARQQANRTR
jgi:transketolase